MMQEAHAKASASNPSRGWLAEYEAEFAGDPEYLAEGLAIRIAEQAVRLMEEQGISRAELASRMGVSKAYITRLFNAPPNLTLRSIAQLALALGVKPQAGLVIEESATKTKKGVCERPLRAAQRTNEERGHHHARQPKKHRKMAQAH